MSSGRDCSCCGVVHPFAFFLAQGTVPCCALLYRSRMLLPPLRAQGVALGDCHRRRAAVRNGRNVRRRSRPSAPVQRPQPPPGTPPWRHPQEGLPHRLYQRLQNPADPTPCRVVQRPVSAGAARRRLRGETHAFRDDQTAAAVPRRHGRVHRPPDRAGTSSRGEVF